MDSSELFDHLSSKISQLFYGRTQLDRNGISKALDELNSQRRYINVRNPTKAVLLINQCCASIQPDDDLLMPKCAQLITSLVTNQNICVKGPTLTLAIQWCLLAAKNTNRNIVLDALKALECLIRNNVQHISVLLDAITKDLKSKIDVEKCFKDTQINDEILLTTFKCLEASTVLPLGANPVENLYIHFERCANIFSSFLCQRNYIKCSIFTAKILEICIQGLQNIISVYPDYLKKELGVILGIVRTYMLYSIKDVEFLLPERIMPAMLSVPETPIVVKEKTGGKVTKQRKHRSSGTNKKKEKKNKEEYHFENKSGGYQPATVTLEYNSDSGVGNASPYTSRLKTSDSDFSDTDGGKLAKLSHCCNKVRQAALNLFAIVIRLTDKPTMFTYWSSFIPENASSGKHNLLTCVLKDPSTRGKMCALNTLLVLLTSAKMYLVQAEFSEKTSSFTPFSVILGLSLTELHKYLCLALNQFSVPALTQVLKCMAALVQATPYHRMPPGLITKILRNVKGLVSHKDATVQVTALIVTGCILAFEPQLPETVQAMTKIQRDDSCLLSSCKNGPQNPPEDRVSKEATSALSSDEFDYAQFSSEEEEEELAVIEIDSMPWLLQRCLTNLGVTFEDSGGKDIGEHLVPAPVKLESLQVLSAMSRNYFESLMLPHLNYVTKALEISLVDKYSDLRLHAGRAVDFLGQAIGRMSESEVSGSSMCLNFWHNLLNGPLVALVQNEQHPALRAVGCDCLGSIGPHIFQQLPRDRQILCVTLLFACTKDEENTVRGASVRALALSVLYPSLREDPGFVMDTAESILQALKDEHVNVRVKASWSLGNLSDALVLNSKLTDSSEDSLPEKILLNLLEASIRSSNDNEKIKMNVVRAIGNLVQLVNADLLKEEKFKNASEQALNALVKASTTGVNMKARWNACYALGNALKNPALYTELDASVWQPSTFTKLSELVIGFKNFKVRINAALALSSPTTREQYGQFFVPLWTTLLQALENSQNIDDFTEYKHRDHLVEQICLCLGHLTTLLTKEDLPQLQAILELYLDTFKINMHKVIDRLVPEKSTDLFSASCSLTNLESRSDITGAAEKQVIVCLKSIFVPEL